MEQNLIELSSWWWLLAIGVVLFCVWLYRTIVIFRDPEFRFSMQSGIPYRLVKEYQQAWNDIKAANKKKGCYDSEKAKEIISNLSDIRGWNYYSKWKLEEYNRKISEKLQSSDWWHQDLTEID